MNQRRWVLLTLLMLFPCKAFSLEYDTNTIHFEHWRHYESQGIACKQCHAALASGLYSLPDHKVCGFCHKFGPAAAGQDSDMTTCGTCHPRNNGHALTRLNLLPRQGKRVFFHSSGLDQLCDLCHGKMLDDLIPMGQLLTSSKERIRIRQKSHYFYTKQECDNCHHGMTKESPPDSHTAGWARDHQKIAPQFNCQICHTKGFCQDCHESIY